MFKISHDSPAKNWHRPSVFIYYHSSVGILILPELVHVKTNTHIQTIACTGTDLAYHLFFLEMDKPTLQIPPMFPSCHFSRPMPAPIPPSLLFQHDAAKHHFRTQDKPVSQQLDLPTLLSRRACNNGPIYSSKLYLFKKKKKKKVT